MTRTLLLLLALPGCTLIDQRTFNPEAGAAPVIPPAAIVAAPVPQGPPALLTILPGQPAGDSVKQAVAAARRRKPDVAFDVVAMVPAADADAQAGPASTEAGIVARAIAAEGVPAAQVRLLARPDAALSRREVRVYVR